MRKINMNRNICSCLLVAILLNRVLKGNLHAAQDYAVS